MKYDIPALTAWATKSAAQFWVYAKKEFAKINYDIGNMPAIVMNSRLTATAGRAFDDCSKVDLSCYHMTRNYEHFHKDTIPHELCHIITNKLYPNAKQHHGKEWKNVVDFLKVKTSIYHNLGTKAQHERGVK